MKRESRSSNGNNWWSKVGQGERREAWIRVFLQGKLNDCAYSLLEVKNERKEYVGGYEWYVVPFLSLFPLLQVSFAGSIPATECFASNFFDRFFCLFVRFLLARFDVDPMQMQRLDCGRSKFSTLRVWVNRAPNESLYLTKKRKRDAAARFPWITDKNNSSFNR